MNHISKHITERRSVRTFDGCTVNEATKDQLLSFAGNITNPWNIPVTFKFLDAKKDGLICPVVSGTDLYAGGKVRNVPNASVAFGYSFEMFVLYAQSHQV